MAVSPQSQAFGAILAMTSNFLLNNFLTYRDQRLKGLGILRGLLVVLSGMQRRSARQCRRCVLGLRSAADLVASRRAGALMGVVWNYAMSSLFVWRKR